MIGPDIEVMVTDSRGGQSWLGINAPANVEVHRKEVFEEIARQRAARDQAEAADLPLADRPACPQGRPAQGAERIERS